MLSGKKILIGISGSIAAYKIAALTRLLTKADVEVKIIMTPLAASFITPLTLSTLSKNCVLSELYDPQTGEWHNHVALGLWADALLIAPATSNTIAKITYGLADNLLIATYLSARCPVFIAPAMDLDMYTHPSTIQNLRKLQQYGNIIIDAEEGELASGLSGKGRMAEPENIVRILRSFFRQKNDLSGKNVMITVGPTQEFIDPVRYVSNPSSGKMGYAIAEEMANRGGSINLVSGPVSMETQHPNINVVKVNSAKEMYQQATVYFNNSDVAVFTAAVSDYTPKCVSDKKIKKQNGNMNIALEKTVDIAKILGRQKTSKQFLMGFALETDNEMNYAQQKLITKNLDCIVLNSLKDQGAGFVHDTNVVTIIDKEKSQKLPLKSKKEIAKDIVDYIIGKIQ